MIVTALLGSLWQGALIVAIAAIASACVPRHHAASKYLVWCTALAALAAVPGFAAFYPQDVYVGVPGVVIRASAATSAMVTRTTDFASLWLLAAWAAGVIVGVSRLLVSAVRIANMLRASRPAVALGEDVRISDRIDVPVAAGMLHPVVVLPAQMARALSAVELRALIEHERAHIARGDIWTNFLARSLEALLFFNPWVYLIGRELVKQREAACDDRAVIATGTADAYATSLASVALAVRYKDPLLTPSAIGSKRLLLARIARLLTGKETVVKANYVPATACALAFVLLAFTLATKASAQSNDVAGSSLPANCNRTATMVVQGPLDLPNGTYANASADALVTIDAGGHPLKAKVVTSSGNDAIGPATATAAMRSTYKPKIANCKAVAGTYLFQVKVSGVVSGH